jgi:acetyl-CoA carboxylase beta subunit
VTGSAASSVPRAATYLSPSVSCRESLWIKSPDTGQLIFYKDAEANQFLIPASNHRIRMDAQQRACNRFSTMPTARRYQCWRRRKTRCSSATATLHRSHQDRQLDDAVFVDEGMLEAERSLLARYLHFMAGSAYSERALASGGPLSIGL